MPDETTPAAQPAAPIPTNAADLARDLAADMPRATAPLPTHHGPAAPADVLPPPAAPAAAPETDSLGRAFDAGRFATDASGKPRRDKLGRFFSRLLGRGNRPPPPSAPPPASFIPSEGATPPPTPSNAAEGPGNGPGKASGDAGPDKYALLADVYTRAAIAGAMGLLGDEWEPDNDAEFRGLRDSVAAYLRATQREELSPGWALALAGITYGARRIPRQKTQARLAFFRAKLAAWWRGRSVAHAVASMPGPGGVA